MSKAMTFLYSALEHSERASPRTREMVYAAIARFMILQASAK